MPTNEEGADDFVHQLAIKLSRVLNLVNPNDLLSRRVIEIAKNNSLEEFINGVFASFLKRLFLIPLQRQRLLASLKTLFLLNCMPIFCRMLSRRKLALPRNPCRGLLFMIVMFCNQNPQGLAALHVGMWYVVEHLPFDN